MNTLSDDPLRGRPEQMTPRQVAEAMGKSRQTISNWLNLIDDPLPGTRLPSGRWMVRREELRAWLAARHN